MPKIPNKIHFVWLGGPIPKEYLASIKKLATIAKKSNFEINLWVDHKRNYLITAVKEEIEVPYLRLRHINELADNMEKDDFYKTYPNKAKQYQSYIMREMIGLYNLGAASDLLRYEIERQEGGYYFDTDTKFDDTPLLRADTPKYGFLCAGTYSKNSLAQFFLGNDMFASVKNHELLRKLIYNIMITYNSFDNNQTWDKANEESENLQNQFAKEGKERELIISSNKFNENVMDRKRAIEPSFESSREGIQYEDKLELTMIASGPKALSMELCLFGCSPGKDDPKLLTADKRDTCNTNKRISVEFKFAGIWAKRFSAMAWCHTRIPKITSFDDSCLPCHSLFFSKNGESKVSSEKTNILTRMSASSSSSFMSVKTNTLHEVQEETKVRIEQDSTKQLKQKPFFSSKSSFLIQHGPIAPNYISAANSNGNGSSYVKEKNIGNIEENKVKLSFSHLGTKRKSC